MAVERLHQPDALGGGKGDAPLMVEVILPRLVDVGVRRPYPVGQLPVPPPVADGGAPHPVRVGEVGGVAQAAVGDNKGKEGGGRHRGGHGGKALFHPPGAPAHKQLADRRQPAAKQHRRPEGEVPFADAGPVEQQGKSQAADVDQGQLPQNLNDTTPDKVQKVEKSEVTDLLVEMILTGMICCGI